MIYDSLFTPVVIMLLLLVSAFFSGTETALTAASKARLHKMAQKGDKKAKLASKLQASRQRLLSVLLLANNVVNVFASALATGFLIFLMGDRGVAVATVVMTLLILVFAEIAPKLYAIENPTNAAKRVAPVANMLIKLLGRPATALERLCMWLIKPLKKAASSQAEISEEELEGAIEIHAEEGGATAKTEHKMLRSILQLDDVPVSRIMIHKKEVISLNASLTPRQAVGKVGGHTRIPLWQGDESVVVGVLHTKNLLKALGDASVAHIGAIASKPWFIPETTTLLSQLQAFRRNRSHLALVVDEYGMWEGIVTLEDILEEIVGEIDDEFDARPMDTPLLLADGSVTIAGDYGIRALNRRFDWNLPDEEVTSIGGLILLRSGVIPKPKTKFSFYGFGFEVLSADHKQITLVKVTPPPLNKSLL